MTDRNKPWREIKGWNSSARDELKKEVVALRPETSLLHIPSFNIVLAGLIGSGKSSFINSISSVIRGSVYLTVAAGVGERAGSLTKEFYIYQISPDLPFRICDTMGIDSMTDHEVDFRNPMRAVREGRCSDGYEFTPGEEFQSDSEVDIINIMRAVEGHVPDGYEFTPGKEFQSDSSDYISDPNPADRAHCVAIVVNAEKANVMEDNTIKKLKKLAECLSVQKKIPLVVLLTHLDEYCKEVQEDVTTVFHSIAVENLVSKISKMVHGLPENHIFPVINYTKRVEIDPDVDILLLYALRQMLGVSKAYTEKLEKQHKKTQATDQKLDAALSDLKFGEQDEAGKEQTNMEKNTE